ncbi:MAG TPA: hypothetical protein VLF43_02605 [Candidatus Saccharimonadales bacterium]|nr:hypothetical protein [Candidatus Saccharimonadales bacterium]
MKQLIPTIRKKLGLRPSTEVALTPEAVDNSETLPRENRVVIFGTNRGGVFQLQEDLTKFFTEQGIEDSEVVALRQIDNIEDGFFGLLPKDGDPVAPPSLPMGVIALPSMRYTDGMGHGMTVDTPVEYIADMCKKHEIPFVAIERGVSTEQSVAALALTQQMQREQLPPAS